MMKATVTVMLKNGVLDPQGKAIGQALHGLGFGSVGEVRAGKVIELELAESLHVRRLDRFWTPGWAAEITVRPSRVARPPFNGEALIYKGILPPKAPATSFYTYPELDFPPFRPHGRGCP